MQGVHVDQLLPVLLFLVEAVMESESIRAELEEGTKQARDARANYHKLFKEETERWAAEKAVLMEEKPTGEKEKTKKPDPWRIKVCHSWKCNNTECSIISSIARPKASTRKPWLTCKICTKPKWIPAPLVSYLLVMTCKGVHIMPYQPLDPRKARKTAFRRKASVLERRDGAGSSLFMASQAQSSSHWILKTWTSILTTKRKTPTLTVGGVSRTSMK